MRVYTYHESVKEMPDQTALINLWEKSWRKQGWTPIILGKKDAQSHPNYDGFLAKVSRYPTVNPKSYELACFKRWLALAQQEGGWMVDYDVINYGFPPTEPSEELTLHAGDWCPCVTSGNLNAYTVAVGVFENYQGNWETYPGKPHLSDQDILKNNRHLFKIQTACRNYSVFGWEKMPLVHYPNGLMLDKQPRHRFIPQLRAGL